MAEFFESQREISDEQTNTYESAKVQSRFTLLKAIEQLEYLDYCYLEVTQAYLPVLMEVWQDEFSERVNIEVEKDGVKVCKV